MIHSLYVGDIYILRGCDLADFDYFGLGEVVRQYNFQDKDKNVRAYITYMLNRLMTMFEYEGLPDTIPHRMLEIYIMVNGHSVIIEHEGNLYVCFGGWGGKPNEYYMPENYIVANPYLNLFKTYTIDEDCVLINNDSMYFGLMPMLRRYATTLVENDLSMFMVDVNSRICALIDAQDDKTRLSAEKYLKDILDGKFGVIGSTAFFEGVRTQPYGEHNTQLLTDLIEYQQYTKASWFNEIGLNANYNMKRESLNSNESQLNDDMLLPLIDDMYQCRKAWIEKVNEKYGTNISIKWGSSWANNERELELEQEIMESQVDEGGVDDDTDIRETRDDGDDVPTDDI